MAQNVTWCHKVGGRGRHQCKISPRARTGLAWLFENPIFIFIFLRVPSRYTYAVYTHIANTVSLLDLRSKTDPACPLMQIKFKGVYIHTDDLPYMNLKKLKFMS